MEINKEEATKIRSEIVIPPPPTHFLMACLYQLQEVTSSNCTHLLTTHNDTPALKDLIHIFSE